jgi:hypothetical protein
MSWIEKNSKIFQEKSKDKETIRDELSALIPIFKNYQMELKNSGFINKDQNLEVKFDFIGHDCAGGSLYYGMRVKFSKDISFYLYLTEKNKIAIEANIVNQKRETTSARRISSIKKFVKNCLLGFMQSMVNSNNF